MLKFNQQKHVWNLALFENGENDRIDGRSYAEPAESCVDIFNSYDFMNYWGSKEMHEQMHSVWKSHVSFYQEIIFKKNITFENDLTALDK